MFVCFLFFFSSRRRHTRFDCDWSSDVCSSDLFLQLWRDRLALTLMLFVPVAMLFIFGWAINTDVKHVPTAVVDLSGSVERSEERRVGKEGRSRWWAYH